MRNGAEEIGTEPFLLCAHLRLLAFPKRSNTTQCECRLTNDGGGDTSLVGFEGSVAHEDAHDALRRSLVPYGQVESGGRGEAGCAFSRRLAIFEGAHRDRRFG